MPECRTEVTWIDDRREPQNKVDPAWPTGKDVIAFGARPEGVKTCRVELPYPARRCGWYLVKCKTCDQHIMISTAGRRDDPKSLTFECKRTVLHG